MIEGSDSCQEHLSSAGKISGLEQAGGLAARRYIVDRVLFPCSFFLLIWSWFILESFTMDRRFYDMIFLLSDVGITHRITDRIIDYLGIHYSLIGERGRCRR